MAGSSTAGKAIADASLAVLKDLGARGSAYQHSVVRAFQNTWNANYRAAFPTSAPEFASAASSLVALDADGVYGPKTQRALNFLLPPTAVSLPVIAASIPTWWRANGTTISSFINDARMRMSASGGGSGAEAAAIRSGETRVPDTTGSTSRAGEAVDVGTSATARIVAAGERDLPTGLPPSDVPGLRPVGEKSAWPWIAGGLAVLAFGGVIAYFAFSKHGKRSFKV